MSIGKGTVMMSLWDYVPKSNLTMSSGDIALPMKKGDKVTILELCPNDWLRVSLNGKKGTIGVVPRPYLTLVPGSSPPLTNPQITVQNTANQSLSEDSFLPKGIKYVKALWKYDATGTKMSSGDVDLSFNKFDIMIFVDDCPNDWIRVKRNDQVGVIPKNFVLKVGMAWKDEENKSIEEFERQEAEKQRKRQQQEEPLIRGIALQNSQPINPDDLEFYQGDIVYILEKENAQKPGKWRGECNGQTGFFPSNLVQLVSANQAFDNSTLKQRGSKIVTAPLQSIISPNTNPNAQLSVNDVKLPSSYPFSIADSPKTIIMENGKVTAATLLKLVERLTYPEYVDTNFVYDFLLTYRSFTTREELIKLLKERFNLPDHVEGVDAALYQQRFVRPIRLRVANVVKKWVDEFFQFDFVDATSLIDEVTKFGEEMKQKGLEGISDAILRLLLKKTGHSSYSSRTDSLSKGDGSSKNTSIMSSFFGQQSPDPYAPDESKLVGVPSALQFLVFHPEEIARQLSMIDFELWEAIKPSECLSLNWSKSSKEEKAPNLLGMIERFNKVTYWVVGTIVQIPNTKARAEAVSRFIDIAEKLRGFNNFGGVMEIIAGLRSAAVSRLKKTWDLVSGKSQQKFQELVELMSPDSNYKRLRAVIRTKVNPPAVPYLGLYLTDLTFIEDGNPNTITSEGVELINFDKRRRTAEVIREIRRFQQMSYNYQPVPIIKGYLLAGCGDMDDNQSFQLSLEREPRDGSKPKSSFMTMAFRKDRKKSTPGKLNPPTMKGTPTKNPPSSTTPTPAPTQLNTSANSKDDETTIDDLLDCLLQGNNQAIDEYFKRTNKPLEQQEVIREQLAKLFEARMQGSGAIEVISKTDDEESLPEEIPYEMLKNLYQSKPQEFEEYLKRYDVFKAVRIRSQIKKLAKML